MAKLTVTVLGKPADPSLKALERIPKDVEIVVSDQWDVLEKSLPQSDAVAIGVFQGPLWPRAVILATKARWFHAVGAGVERLLTPETIAHPAVMTNGQGVFRRPLGDWAVAMMLHFAFDLPRILRQQREGQWIPFTSPGIERRTLGIIGYGGIGSAAAERAKPFGVRILALRRRTALIEPTAIVDQFFPPEKMNDMIAQCDYILLATPLTPETRKMFGASQIAAMKPNAVLINVGRGQVVDEAGLIHALETGAIRGAALDVVEQEPLPSPHPLYSLPNVVLSPHCADNVEGFMGPAVERLVENLERFIKGEPLHNVVDKQAGY
jgi:phosphoglycerate dehydrogenase-like enzyme